MALAASVWYLTDTMLAPPLHTRQITRGSFTNSIGLRFENITSRATQKQDHAQSLGVVDVGKLGAIRISMLIGARKSSV